MNTPYHSALHKALSLTQELDHYEANGSIVFKNDITRNTSPYYSNLRQDTDAIYSELAWQAGYDRFQRRARPSRKSSFQDYLQAINNLIAHYKKPIFFVMGKHMLNALNPPYASPIKLNGREAMLCVWNYSLVFDDGKSIIFLRNDKGYSTDPIVLKWGRLFSTNNGIINYVSDRFNTVGDFSCGYGNLAAAMLKNNKKFICSDINGKCVYYVAKTYMGYKE
jgi:hypothetical protein